MKYLLLVFFIVFYSCKRNCKEFIKSATITYNDNSKVSYWRVYHNHESGSLEVYTTPCSGKFTISPSGYQSVNGAW